MMLRAQACSSSHPKWDGLIAVSRFACMYTLGWVMQDMQYLPLLRLPQQQACLAQTTAYTG